MTFRKKPGGPVRDAVQLLVYVMLGPDGYRVGGGTWGNGAGGGWGNGVMGAIWPYLALFGPI